MKFQMEGHVDVSVQNVNDLWKLEMLDQYERIILPITIPKNAQARQKQPCVLPL